MAINELLIKYDLYYINPSAEEMGFMLAKGKGKAKLWRRTDERPLPDSYATGDISYANLSPDIQKIIAQRLLHAGLGASEHEVEEDTDFYALRYLRSQNVDLRCRGKAYLGPKIVELNLPTPPTYYAPSLTDGGLEVWTNNDLDNWIETFTGNGVMTKEAKLDEGDWSAFLATGATAGTAKFHQAIAWHNEYKGHYFTFKGSCKATAANIAYVEIDDGIRQTRSSYHVGDSTTDPITVTHQVSPVATQLHVICGILTADNKGAYFDKMSLTTLYSEAALNTVPCFVEFGGAKYGAFGNILGKLNTGTGTYDYVYHFPANITDMCHFVISGVEYLFIALGDDEKIWYMVDAPSDVLVENCEDAWNEYVDSDVTSTADTGDKQVGSASAKLEVADGCAAGDILATEVISSLDLDKKEAIYMWIKSNVALDANDLQLLFDNTAKCESPLLTVNVPAVEADTWTKVSMSITPNATYKGIVSVGIKMVVDKNVFTLHLDEIRASYSPHQHGSEQAYHFAATPSTFFAIKEAGGNYLRKATDPTGAFSNVSTPPGSPSDNQNDLINAGGTIWIMKEGSVHYLDSSNNIQEPFPGLATLRHADAGKNSVVFLNRLYFRMGEQQEWEIDGVDLTEVTPSNFAPDISQYAYPCVARAGDESWLYSIIKRSTPLNEYYNAGDTTGVVIYGATHWHAQTFTPSTAHKIISVKLKMYRDGSPGTITVSIKATDDDGHPTGDDLCSGTTNGNTLPTSPPYEWREITLGNGYDLDAGTKYAIVARALDGDGMNFVGWRCDTSSPTYAGGNNERSVDGGSSWTTFSEIDLMFEDWGITDLAILAGRWEYIAGRTRWIWHEIRSIDLTDVACAFVSSVEGRPFLYLGSTDSSDKVYKVYLPLTNDATADSGYRFYTAGSLWSPKYRTLLFAADKLWQELTARSSGLSSDKCIEVNRSQDAGASFTLLGTLETSPEQTLNYPAGIESSQMNLRFYFKSDVDTAGPVLLDYNLKAILMMASVTRFWHSIKCGDNLILKKNVQSATTLSAIATFINGIRDKVCTLGDLDGNEHTVKVRVENDYETIDLETNRPIRIYDIQAIKL